MKKILLTVVALVALASCTKQNDLHTVEYSAKTNSPDFEFRYLGSNGDTNTVNVKGTKIGVIPMRFDNGQTAWCEINSVNPTMGKVQIITDNVPEVSNGLAFSLAIKKIIK